MEQDFVNGFVDELEKIAKIIGMTYDPRNPHVKSLQKTHGAAFKGVMAGMKGLGQSAVTPLR